MGRSPGLAGFDVGTFAVEECQALGDVVVAFFVQRAGRGQNVRVIGGME
jgi:hypothetical protein